MGVCYVFLYSTVNIPCVAVTLKHVAKTVAHVELTDHVVNVVFTLFDDNSKWKGLCLSEGLLPYIYIFNFHTLFILISIPLVTWTLTHPYSYFFPDR